MKPHTFVFRNTSSAPGIAFQLSCRVAIAIVWFTTIAVAAEIQSENAGRNEESKTELYSYVKFKAVSAGFAKLEVKLPLSWEANANYAILPCGSGDAAGNLWLTSPVMKAEEEIPVGRVIKSHAYVPTNVERYRVHYVVPDGFEVYWRPADSTEPFRPGSVLESTVFNAPAFEVVVVKKGETGALPGKVIGADTGDGEMRFSLGYQSSGKSAGFIDFRHNPIYQPLTENGFGPAWGRPLGAADLRAIGLSDEVQVITVPIAGHTAPEAPELKQFPTRGVRQILAPQTIVDVSKDGYDLVLKFYSPTQRGAGISSESNPWGTETVNYESRNQPCALSGEPFLTYRISWTANVGDGGARVSEGMNASVTMGIAVVRVEGADVRSASVAVTDYYKISPKDSGVDPCPICVGIGFFTCPECDGAGGDYIEGEYDWEPCLQCSGGIVEEDCLACNGTGGDWIICDGCQGEGEIDEDCGACDATGTVSEDCEACNANGSVQCPSCGGASCGCAACGFKGTVDCDACSDGTIDVDCDACEGGQIASPCGVCEGTPISWMLCFGCGGRGRLDAWCLSCSGEGGYWIRLPPEFIRCGVCDGLGTVDCRDCDGTGVIEFDIPESIDDSVDQVRTIQINDFGQSRSSTIRTAFSDLLFPEGGELPSGSFYGRGISRDTTVTIESSVSQSTRSYEGAFPRFSQGGMLSWNGSAYTPTFHYLAATQKLVTVKEGDSGLRTDFGYFRKAFTNPRQGSEPLTYTDQLHDTHHGRLKWRKEANGGWAMYDYASTLASLNRVTKVVTPYLDTAMPVDLPEGSAAPGYRITTTSYAADWEGVNRLPSEILETADNQTVGHTKTSYSSGTVNGEPVWVATSYTYPSSALDNNDGAALRTVTKVFEGANVSLWLRGLPYSLEKPDGTKQSFLHQRGSYDAGSKSFTAGAGGAAARTVKFNGSARSDSGGTLTGTYADATIDGLYLVSGRSTAEVTIRDDRANVVRTEVLVYSGGTWTLIDSADLQYDIACNLIRREKLNGALYEAIYTDANGASESFAAIKFNNAAGTRTGHKEYERDEQGLITKFYYNPKGLVEKTVRLEVSGVPAVTTSYAYDDSNRLLSTTVESPGENLVSGNTYNNAGQVTSETEEGLTTNYNYTVVDGIVTETTVTLPGGATRVLANYLDGRPKSATGTAAIAEYYSYAVSGGQEVTTKFTGANNGARWSKSYADWADRPVKTETSAHNGTAAAPLTADNSYNTFGQLYRTKTDVLAPTLRIYDGLGALIETGTDLDDNGSLGTTDRRQKTLADIREDSGAWWSYGETLAFPDGETTGKTTARIWTRLTGFSSLTPPSGVSGSAISETISADANNNRTTVQVFLDRSAGTLTSVTRSPFATTPAITVAVAERIISQTTTTGTSTTFGYDALGRQNTATGRTGTTTTTYVTGTTRVQSMTDTRSIRQHYYAYDGAGRVTVDTTPHIDASGSASGYVSTRYAYNSRGQQTHVWGDVPYPVKYDYDDSTGERTGITTYRSGTWTAADLPTNGWPATGDTTAFAYYAESGQLKQRKDAQLRTVDFTYNVRGQTLTATTSRNIVRHYDYYEAAGAATGEPKQVSYTGESGYQTPTVSYTYDRLGRTKTVTDATGDRTFTYRDSSDLQPDQEKFGRLGTTTTTHYLGNNRQFTYAYESGTGRLNGAGLTNGTTSDYAVSYGFDPATARLQSVTSGAGAFTYSYLPNSELVTGVVHGSGYQQARTFEPDRNALDTLTITTAAGQLAAFDYTLDDLGRRRRVDQSGTLYASYVAAGEIMRTAYGYNDRNELVSSATRVGAAATVDAAAALAGRGFGYDFDPIGNRTAEKLDGTSYAYTPNSLNQYTGRATPATLGVSGIANRSGGATVNVAGTALAAGDWRNNYFFKSVPKSATATAGYQTIALSATGGGGTATESVATATRPVAESFTYDLDGNLTDDALWRYVYDGENRLVALYGKVADASGLPALRFTYDYLGRRVAKEVWTYTGTLAAPTMASIRSQTYFAWLGWSLVAEYSDDGGIDTLRRRYTWGKALSGAGDAGSLLALEDMRPAYIGTYLAVPDGHGNVVGLAFASGGQLAAEYEYDPSGNVLRSSGRYGTENPLRFAGKYLDRETGLSYYGLRYYSATLGRFINRDPIGETGGLNIYGFAHNDAINGGDLLGLAWWNNWSHFKQAIRPSWLTPRSDHGARNRTRSATNSRRERTPAHMAMASSEAHDRIRDQLDTDMRKIHGDKWQADGRLTPRGMEPKAHLAGLLDNASGVGISLLHLAAQGGANDPYGGHRFDPEAEKRINLATAMLTRSARDGITKLTGISAQNYDRQMVDGVIDLSMAAWGFTSLGRSLLLRGAALSSATAEIAAAENATQRVFWSGGRAAEDAARTFATGNRGVIIGDTAAGRALAQATEGVPWSQARPQWLDLSKDFARGASGEVNVFQNARGLSLDSIWREEFKILTSNPNVTKINFHVVMPDGSIVIY